MSGLRQHLVLWESRNDLQLPHLPLRESLFRYILAEGVGYDFLKAIAPIVSTSIRGGGSNEKSEKKQ